MERVTLAELMGPLNENEKKFAPPVVFVEGNRSLMADGPRVSIIGSRKASKEGLENAAALARALVKKGIIVVSGLAEGIDTVAHKTAMNEGGKTIAVLGTPLDRCYPAENRELQDEIMKNQLVISQFVPLSPVQEKNFVMRNRTMALISHASVVVEAAEKSGTRYQAWEALRLGRPLFILESVAKDQKLKWPKEVMKYGARVISVKDVKPLLDVLPASGGLVSLDVAF